MCPVLGWGAGIETPVGLEQREAEEGGEGRGSGAETLESFPGHFKEFGYNP